MCKKRKDSCCCCPTNQIIMPAVPSHGWSPKDCCCENKSCFDKFAYAALSQQNNSITTLLTASILSNGRGCRDDYGHNYHHGHHNDYHGHHGYGHHGYGGYGHDRWGGPLL